MERIYLDNAATSFPKPEVVYDAVDRYQRNSGAAVGRSSYGEATAVHSAVRRCRRLAAELLGAESPERIAFTFNGTDGLNLAIHGLLEPGDHAVTSTIEHNSVLRPLRALQDRSRVEVTHIAPGNDGRIRPDDVRDALRANTRLVALIHASNVSGAIQPVAEVGEIARTHGALFLLDAAQSAGHVPINLATLPVDLLACPGHKGLLGPLGTGLLYVRPGVEERLHSMRQGGTGSRSEDDRQPATLPDKYESGNHNTPGLIGLEAALAWLNERGVEHIQRHERELCERLIAGMREIDGVRVQRPQSPADSVGVVGITVDGLEPQDLAGILDESFGIQTRAGLHCAPGAHRELGTFDSGGTVRFSIGPFNTEAHIDAAIDALRSLSAG